MSPQLHPLAGQPASSAALLDVAATLSAYTDLRPDPTCPEQRVAFGTSGHRGRASERSFNEWHVLAITQAICDHRAAQGVDGPLFIGIDTHALSRPAFDSALEVLAGNGVAARISLGGEFTPTPAISHAILVHNQGRDSGLADGIVLTPSHNPPEYGGYKYNPPDGGGAATGVTRWIEQRANALIETGLRAVKRMPLAQARRAATTREHDFLGSYVADLDRVLDFDLIRSSGIRMGVDPLGGAGLHYWPRIAERYRLDLTVVSGALDPCFAFMSLDWDGKIRMDPSSTFAMQRLIGMAARFDIAFACDTDHDRHSIVAPSVGLLPANHYLAAAIDYLFRHRPAWSQTAAIGKTVVSSSLIDRVAARLGRSLYEVPAGFKWFVEGLHDATLGFAGEESAGASFSRMDGSVWTTDKDGMTAALLSAEMTARTGRDPGQLYQSLVQELGELVSDRVEAAASASQRSKLGHLTAAEVGVAELAGEPIESVLDRAPGNGEPIGGIKIITAGGWFAARPSGTEDIYKIYAESCRDRAHLESILSQAQQIVDAAIA
jgi:phosphoglucomutase